MDQKPVIYNVELLCDYPQWWRYNVYIMAACYGAAGESLGMVDMQDKIYEPDFGGEPRTAPPGFALPRELRLATAPCARIELWVYVVANTFPPSEVIGDSPSFPLGLRVSAGGSVALERDYEVNQWGGLTVAGLGVG